MYDSNHFAFLYLKATNCEINPVVGTTATALFKHRHKIKKSYILKNFLFLYFGVDADQT